MKDLQKRLAWLKEFKAWTEAGAISAYEYTRIINTLKKIGGGK